MGTAEELAAEVKKLVAEADRLAAEFEELRRSVQDSGLDMRALIGFWSLLDWGAQRGCDPKAGLMETVTALKQAAVDPSSSQEDRTWAFMLWQWLATRYPLVHGME